MKIKKMLLSGLLMGAVSVFCGAHAFAAPVIGEKAPAFTGTDSKNIEHSLSDYAGKVVVLEWTNHGCPYVRKHYDAGNMQALQKEATERGVIWLTIASSANGKQGYTTPEDAEKLIAEEGAAATARILDPSGEIGRAYDAKTTPHMFVINQEGVLVYDGAIDNDPSFKPDSIATATNYVKQAWQAVLDGKEVETSKTHPYGCAVKYE